MLKIPFCPILILDLNFSRSSWPSLHASMRSVVSMVFYVLWCMWFTWEQGEGDRIYAVLLCGAGALGVGDVHLELHRLLENRRTSCGLVLCPETGLRDDAVAQTGNLGRETVGEGRRVRLLKEQRRSASESAALGTQTQDNLRIS